jgi:hypothetical protein
MVMGLCRGIPSNQSLVVGRDSHRFKDRMGLPLCFTPPSRGTPRGRTIHLLSEMTGDSVIFQKPVLLCRQQLRPIRLFCSASCLHLLWWRDERHQLPRSAPSSPPRQHFPRRPPGATVSLVVLHLETVMRHSTMMSMNPSNATSRRTPSNCLPRLLLQWSTPRANSIGRPQLCTTTRCPPLPSPRGTTWTVTRSWWHTPMLGARMIAHRR